MNGEERFVEDLGFPVGPCLFVGIEEWFGYDYLVEEVPRAVVRERAVTFVEEAPHGIVESVLFDLFSIFLCVEHYGTRVVVGVVVEVAHDNDFGFWLFEVDRVAYLSAEHGGGVACRS